MIGGRFMILKYIHWALLGGTLCLITGLAGTMIGIEELRLALLCGKDPRTISCAELASRGPGGNAHITLTGYSARWEGTLTWSRNPEGAWDSVTVPLAPGSGQKCPRPRDVRAVIILSGVRNAQDLQKVLARGKLTGLVKSRGSADKYLLQRNPGIPADRCWVIWEGRSAWSSAAAGTLLVIAVAAFTLGIVLIVRTAQTETTPELAGTNVIFLMVPLTRLLTWMSALGQRWLSPGTRGAVLVMMGIPVLMVGGVLLWKGGLYSLEGSTGQLIVGAVLINTGIALSVLGCLPARRSDQLEPVAAARS